MNYQKRLPLWLWFWDFAAIGAMEISGGVDSLMMIDRASICR
jgi:hypothetical protein